MLKKIFNDLKDKEVSFDTEPLFRKVQKPFFDRIGFYETLAVKLEDLVPLRIALSHMLDVDTDFGRSKGVSALRYVLRDCITAIESGQLLGDALDKWIPKQESIIIRIGETKGSIATALRRAVKMANAKNEIYQAIFTSSAYPMMLVGMSILTMVMVKSRLLPELARTTPKEKWVASLRAISAMSDFIVGNGISLIIISIIIGCAIKFSMSRYNGKFRYYLDFIPPWSIYRTFQGVTFLFNISSLLKVQIDLSRALLLLQKNADPWLFQRIEGARKYALLGNYLGLALKNTGYAFPSKRCINQMILLTEGRGASEAMETYADRWLVEAISSIKKNTRWITVLCLLHTMIYGGLLISSIYDLQMMIQ